jgi:hypothetical protein
MDHDDWTSDDLIGKTIIDLEDRWFDDTWQVKGPPTRVHTHVPSGGRRPRAFDL